MMKKAYPKPKRRPDTVLQAATTCDPDEVVTHVGDIKFASAIVSQNVRGRALVQLFLTSHAELSDMGYWKYLGGILCSAARDTMSPDEIEALLRSPRPKRTHGLMSPDERKGWRDMPPRILVFEYDDDQNRLIYEVGIEPLFAKAMKHAPDGIENLRQFTVERGAVEAVFMRHGTLEVVILDKAAMTKLPLLPIIRPPKADADTPKEQPDNAQPSGEPLPPAT